MKFGTVPVAEAAGAMLAHSLKLPGGRLKKGHVLGAEDLGKLAEAEIAEVTVARPDAGDLSEMTRRRCWRGRSMTGQRGCI